MKLVQPDLKTYYKATIIESEKGMRKKKHNYIETNPQVWSRCPIKMQYELHRELRFF